MSSTKYPTVFNSHLAVKDHSDDGDGMTGLNDDECRVVLHGSFVVMYVDSKKFHLNLTSVIDRCVELAKRKKKR